MDCKRRKRCYILYRQLFVIRVLFKNDLFPYSEKYEFYYPVHLVYTPESNRKREITDRITVCL